METVLKRFSSVFCRRIPVNCKLSVVDLLSIVKSSLKIRCDSPPPLLLAKNTLTLLSGKLKLVLSGIDCAIVFTVVFFNRLTVETGFVTSPETLP